MRVDQKDSDAAYLERVINEIFISDLGDYERMHWTRAGGSIRIAVGCSDLFILACADSEPVEPEDIDRLIELLEEEDRRLFDKTNFDPYMLWVSEKRQRPPVDRVWRHLSDEMKGRMTFPARVPE